MGDPSQPVGTVVHRIHARHDRQQNLGGADVAGRLLSANVLLSCLQGESVGGGAIGIDRDPDESAGQLTLEPGAHCHVAGVWPAEPQLNPEALRRADDNVRTHLAWWLQDGQGQQVCNHNRLCPAGVRRLDERLRITYRTATSGVLQDDPGEVAGR